MADGKARGLAIARTAPAIITGTKLLEKIPQAMWDDIVSGAATMDHTAALAAAFADTSVKRHVEFPSTGVLNVDRMHLPAGCGIKEFIIGNCEIRLRSNFSSGYAHFVRFFRPADAYGYVDNVRIEGGLFNQNNHYMRGQMVVLHLTRGARVVDTIVNLRDGMDTLVTLDASTDVVTAAGHPWLNDDAVSFYAATTAPTGSLPSGTPYYIVNRTTNSFQLSGAIGGAPINFTDTGSGQLYVAYMGSWGFAVGGRDLRMVRTRVLNGASPFQDGHHVQHGDDIGLDHCHSEGGDDAYACGTELGDFDDLANVSIDSCYGYSKRASALKVYVSDPTRSVKGIYANGLYGTGGALRNGSVFLYDNVGTDARVTAAKIDTVRVRNANLKTGSVARTQNTQPQHVLMQGVANCSVQGRFISDNFLAQEYLIQNSDNCSVDLELEYAAVKGVSPGLISTSVGLGSTRSIATTRPTRNLVLNAQADAGATGTPGTIPTGWTAIPSPSQYGVSRNIVMPGKVDGRQPFGLRIAGTATAAHNWQIIPSGTQEIAALLGQQRRARVRLALLSGSLSGITVTLSLQGRSAAGGLLEGDPVTITSLICVSWGDFERLWTMANASTAFCNLMIQMAVANGATVDCTLGLLNPIVE